MKRITIIALLLVLATPAFASQRDGEAWTWVRLMKLIELCGLPENRPDPDKVCPIPICQEAEEQLKSYGNCVYSPGVIGIWDGKHCR